MNTPSSVAIEATDDSLFRQKVFYEIILFVFQIVPSFNLQFLIVILFTFTLLFFFFKELKNVLNPIFLKGQVQLLGIN